MSEYHVIALDFGGLRIFTRTYNSMLPAALGPEVYSASNRNEYQKHKNNNVSGE
jgi:hypothetical protein